MSWKSATAIRLGPRSGCREFPWLGSVHKTWLSVADAPHDWDNNEATHEPGDEATHSVYLILVTVCGRPFFKVGVAQCPKERLRSLSQGFPPLCEARLVEHRSRWHCRAHAENVETEILLACRDRSAGGEWLLADLFPDGSAYYFRTDIAAPGLAQEAPEVQYIASG